MALESRSGRSGGRSVRRSGRRYFRKKGEDAPSSSPGRAPGEHHSNRGRVSAERGERRGGREEEMDARRSRRRRRRSRVRGPASESRQEGIISATELDYTPPQSVFVYTYVSRGDSNERNDMRMEHFSSVGRTMEEYAIDLSKILADDGTLSISRLTPKITEWYEDDELEGQPEPNAGDAGEAKITGAEEPIQAVAEVKLPIPDTEVGSPDRNRTKPGGGEPRRERERGARDNRRERNERRGQHEKREGAARREREPGSAQAKPGEPNVRRNRNEHKRSFRTRASADGPSELEARERNEPRTLSDTADANEGRLRHERRGRRERRSRENRPGGAPKAGEQTPNEGE